MSMICWVIGLTPAQIAVLRKTPSLTTDLVLVAEDEQMKARVAERINRLPSEQRAAAEARDRASQQTPDDQEFATQLAAARANVEPLGPFEPALDLEKSWHILHYLFTGHVDESDAPGNAMLTGEEVGEDVGYGPPRLHDVKETQAFADFLKTQDLTRLQERVNYREMLKMRVYSIPMGQGSDGDHEEGLRTEVASYFPPLRDYVAAMAEKGDGLLLWVS